MTTTNKSTRFKAVFRHLKTSNSVFLLDGGTGEELFRRGVPDDRKIWSANALVHSQHHKTLQQVHTSFLKAGSDAITTNSYGVVPGVGFSDPEERSNYIQLAGRIARQSVTDGNGGNGFVFGSLGPLIESYRADLIRPHKDGVADYAVACRALADHVDAFLAETMSCIEESKQVLEAVSNIYTSRPILLSFALDENSNFRNDENVISGLKRLLAFVAASPKQEQIELLAVLFNCAKPEAITTALKEIRADPELSKQLDDSDIVLGAYANRMTDIDPEWTLADSEEAQPFRKDLNEEQYWSFVESWIDPSIGVKIVGGCCGITPEHIVYIREKLNQGGMEPIR
jgi:homocysteine S-methyltransferase